MLGSGVLSPLHFALQFPPIMSNDLSRGQKCNVLGFPGFRHYQRYLRRLSRYRLATACGTALAFAAAAGSCQAQKPPTAAHAAPPVRAQRLAPTPPMGWNDWAHYQCGFTAQTVLENAKALVQSGLAAAGYTTVTIDDCWMQKTRDAHGDLQADRQRFPQGMKPVADAIHGMGLKFGIYEDAGYATCGGFAGSGEPRTGGRDHFLQDARLFASWGVDYLKLDGCNVYVPRGANEAAAYRKAYAAENAALRAVGRRIVFSESAPAYFQGTPEWYDVLAWVRGYGQLWREGSDMANFDGKDPDHPRFPSVLWNYAYNLPLGRFQTPGNWDDPDFIIGGDGGMSLAETRSQLALWSMMSAPLILSSNVGELSPEAVHILGNQAVIAIDQDRLGKMATLVQRTPVMDVLLKKLARGDYAVAVLNRGDSAIDVSLPASGLGFAVSPKCSLDAHDLWSGTQIRSASALRAKVAAHDTAIWRIHPSSPCGDAARAGAIVMTAAGERQQMEGYARCLSAEGVIEECSGAPGESWTIAADGRLRSGLRCLSLPDGEPAMRPCSAAEGQRWRYTLAGNLRGPDGKCLTATGPCQTQSLTMMPCAHNRAEQIWSLPN